VANVYNYGTGTKSLAAEYKPTGKGKQKAMEPAPTVAVTETETAPKTNADYINEMYDSSMQSQYNQLRQNYLQGDSDLEQEQQKAQQQSDANLSRTYVEAEKARKNYAEVQNAYGLTSGAMAQARLAQDNQLQADMTAIRTTQQEIDAQIERERSLLAKEYAAAISQAQAENDIARAEALYQEAQREEERLRSNQENAAALMAGVGDYSLYAQLYGLTAEQLAKLQPQPKAQTAASPAPKREPDNEEDNPPASAEGSLVYTGTQETGNTPTRPSLPGLEGYVGQSTIDYLNKLYGLTD
jgi:hypothetical protein